MYLWNTDATSLPKCSWTTDLRLYRENFALWGELKKRANLIIHEEIGERPNSSFGSLQGKNKTEWIQSYITAQYLGICMAGIRVPCLTFLLLSILKLMVAKFVRDKSTYAKKSDPPSSKQASTGILTKGFSQEGPRMAFCNLAGQCLSLTKVGQSSQPW